MWLFNRNKKKALIVNKTNIDTLKKVQYHEDLSRAKKEKSYFCGCPENCDICGTAFSSENYLIDGENKNFNGVWAYMCASCFLENGKGIGYGVGQLYKHQTNGNWLKVGGFSPN